MPQPGRGQVEARRPSGKAPPRGFAGGPKRHLTNLAARHMTEDVSIKCTAAGAFPADSRRDP